MAARGGWWVMGLHVCLVSWNVCGRCECGWGSDEAGEENIGNRRLSYEWVKSEVRQQEWEDSEIKGAERRNMRVWFVKWCSSGKDLGLRVSLSEDRSQLRVVGLVCVVFMLMFVFICGKDNIVCLELLVRLLQHIGGYFYCGLYVFRGKSFCRAVCS